MSNGNTVPSWLGDLLFGIRHAMGNGVEVNDADTIDFQGPFTVTYDSVNKKVAVNFGGNGFSTVPGGIVLGSQTPPQAVLSVGATTPVSTGSSPVQILTYPSPAPLLTFADLGIIVRIPLASPGILLFARIQLIVSAGAYGTTFSVLSTTQDTARTTTSSPWLMSAFTLTTSGNNVIVSAQAPTFQAFVSTHAYTGAISFGTVPNAIGDSTNSLVTNGGHLYVVTAGGTDSGSGGPTTTTPGSPQTVGGITYYYVGPASAGVTTYTTAVLLAVETG